MKLSPLWIVRWLTSPGDESPDDEYECRDCGSQYGRRYQVCPDCDGVRVERREW